MKAIIQSKYGSIDDLELREIDKPLVQDKDVLVRVRAASVHPDVWHVVTGLPYALRLMGAGLLRPKNSIPGTDVAGHVEAVGKDVTRFQPGDDVFGETHLGSQWRNGGAYAEYVAVPEDALALKPANVTFEQAAAVPTSGLIVLLNLRGRARVKPGQRVLVNGAGGGVGIFALQIVKAHGANVTAVDGTEKLDMLRSIGADRVIDYTQEDFTQSRERYDLIFDIPGNRSFADYRRVLSPNGTYVLIGHDHFGRFGRRFLGSLPVFFKLMAISLFVKQLPAPDFSMPNKRESMAVLRELIEAGKLTPVVDRTFPLSEVPEAIRYLQEGHAKGKVVITVWRSDKTQSD